MLRYALRSLKREPALVAGVIATFALAIGTNAAMFGLVSRLMLPAPPGVAAPAQLARTTLTTSYPRYQELAARTDVFVAAAAVRAASVIMGRGADAREVKSIAATGSYFAVLGARPALGRFFTPSDDELPSGTPVAVLSHSSWRSRFGAQHDAVGSNVELDGVTYTVIGVAQPGFSGDGISAVDVFVPMSVAFRSHDASWWSETRINLVSVIVRLRDGVTPAVAAGQTRAELESLLPASVRNSPQSRIARWLLGVSLIVLVIATANVGTLLLLRALRKRRDVAVRLALGASHGRLAAQLTAESMLLAFAGAAVGLLLSSWLADVVRATLLPTLAPSDRLASSMVLGLTLVLALAAGAAAGLTPMFLVSQRMLTTDLTGAGTLGSAGRSRAQRTLVGLQVALCTVLLVGAGLFVRSLQRVQGQELGFNTSRLLLVRLDFREPLGGARQDEVHRGLVSRVSSLSGVTGATIIQATPFGHHSTPPISVPGLDEPPNAGGQLATMYAATPDYLRLMDVRLLQGRLLDASDRRGSPLVVLVNETFAREAWPGVSALGKCIRAGHDPLEEPTGGMASAALPCRTVVGVVRDSRVRSLRPVNREASLMQYYVPFEQQPAPPFFVEDPHTISGLLVAVAGDPAAMAPTVQQLIQSSGSTPVYARVQPYQELLDPQLRPWRLGATLFVAFGALALAIAAVGLFGVVSYLVSQRTREIGLRLALGGTGAVVGRSVVFSAVRMVAIGVAIGLVVALAAGPGAQELLFDTVPYDPGALLTAAGSLLLVTVLAAALPAWRAAHVSPMVALRTD